MLFWSDWGQSPQIGGCGLNGAARITVVDTDIKWPNGLTIGTCAVYDTVCRPQCVDYVRIYIEYTCMCS